MTVAVTSYISAGMQRREMRHGGWDGIFSLGSPDMEISSNVVQLLEGTGLQYICISDVMLDDPYADLLHHNEVFCKPANLGRRVTPAEFNPFLICPSPDSRQTDGYYDAWDKPIAKSRIFEIQGEAALKAFNLKWLPVPYTGRLRQKEIHDVDCNNWVRLWYKMKTANTADFVLCVDTEASGDAAGNGFSGFQPAHLNQTFTIRPFSSYFWQSAHLKEWVGKIGRHLTPASELDVFPAFSHYVCLLQLLAKYLVLPDIQLSEPLGETVDVHLFVDVGNSRTCGVLAECLPGTQLQPESFEKVSIRNIYTPNISYSEPFDTRCAFLPSPFDPEFHPELNWSPNFRIPFVLRIGDTVRQKLGEPGSGYARIDHSTLSSPKRYLWSGDQEPSPWFFALPNSSGQPSVIKGEILDYIAEEGNPVWLSDKPAPTQPRYPKSAMMTFFLMEVLFHALSQINSVDYRSRKPAPAGKRVLKSVVVTVPNGMVRAEQQEYERRVSHAVDLFWHYYKLPEADKPQVSLDFDEANCVQLVYLYSIVRDRLWGNPAQAIAMLGRKRVLPGANREVTSVRIASIDIGGGTSDLAITDYVDQARGSVCDLKGVPLCHEGVSVAGDEVVRRIIRDLVMPLVVKAAENVAGPGELHLDHLKRFLGSGVYDNSPNFSVMRALLAQQVWIPIAHEFLRHAARTQGEKVRHYSFGEFFLEGMQPDEHVLDFFVETLHQAVGPEKEVYLHPNTIPWMVSQVSVNEVVRNTLMPTLRIFSEVIAQHNCDLVLLAGKLSALPIVREIIVRLCPVPSSRVVSLTNFESGVWYPFDLDVDCIRDAKTTVAVGAALWFFSERLKTLHRFSLSTDRKLIRAAEIFIGEMSGQQVRDESLMFPANRQRQKFVSLTATTYLGSRYIDCEVSHSNMLYELSCEDIGKYQPPLQVYLQQDRDDRSALSVSRAVDSRGRPVDRNDLRLKLRTLESDYYWLDTGAIW